MRDRCKEATGEGDKHEENEGKTTLGDCHGKNKMVGHGKKKSFLLGENHHSGTFPTKKPPPNPLAA
jgi:hypothetical protein